MQMGVKMVQHPLALVFGKVQYGQMNTRNRSCARAKVLVHERSLHSLERRLR